MNKKIIGGAMALLMAVAPLPGISPVSSLPLFSQTSITAEAAVAGPYRTFRAMPVYFRNNANKVARVVPPKTVINVTGVHGSYLFINCSGSLYMVPKQFVLGSQYVVPISRGTYRTNAQVRLTSNPSGGNLVTVVPARKIVYSCGASMNGAIRVQYTAGNRTYTGWTIGRSLTRV